MSIQFRCHHCNKRVQAPDSAGGKKARCPTCGQTVEVPSFTPDNDEGDPFAELGEYAAAHGSQRSEQPTRKSERIGAASTGGLPDSFVPLNSPAPYSGAQRVQRTQMQVLLLGGLALFAFVLALFAASSLIHPIQPTAERKVDTDGIDNDRHTANLNRPVESTGNLIGACLYVVAGFVLYLLPSIIAYLREHQNAVPILIINLVFGWTVLGWVASLAWAFSSNVTESRQYVRQVIVREAADKDW